MTPGDTTPMNIKAEPDGSLTLESGGVTLRVPAPELATFLARVCSAAEQAQPTHQAIDHSTTLRPVQSQFVGHNDLQHGGAPLEKGAALFLRLPGLGWVLHEMPPQDCQELVRWLQGDHDNWRRPSGASLN